MSLHELINKIWYGHHPIAHILRPVSWVYRLIISIRRWLYRLGLLSIHRTGVTVIIVGNITAGGTGKTPLVIWLVQYLQSQGYDPGVVSRGYGGQVAGHDLLRVTEDSDPKLVGDEPILIAKRGKCRVVVAPIRYLAAEELVSKLGCDIIVADDGLQHYSLHGDIRICVIDGRRRFGNNYCLPAGPLRSPPSYLKEVDMVVSNGCAEPCEYVMKYETGDLINLHHKEKRLSISVFEGQTVHAVAGLGNPAGFFAHLRSHNINIVQHIFPDHHQYKYSEINFDEGWPVIMTEKDAIKCVSICSELHWYLPIEAKLSEQFVDRFNILLAEV